jgi:AcrR family transcriptional regulator
MALSKLMNVQETHERVATESAVGRRGLSVRERRERNREEMRTGILEVAREIMRDQGIAALNLNEIARRVGITTPALYTYFPGKMALYDALYRMGIRLFREAEEELWHTTRPDWERIRAWFELRLRLVEENPELYHMVFDDPIPGFMPTADSMEEVRKIAAAAVRGIGEVIEAGVIQPNLSPEQTTDLLFVMRRGIVAEHIGKHRRVNPPNRFSRLIPEVLAVLQAAWSPKEASADEDLFDMRVRKERNLWQRSSTRHRPGR